MVNPNVILDPQARLLFLLDKHGVVVTYVPVLNTVQIWHLEKAPPKLQKKLRIQVKSIAYKLRREYDGPTQFTWSMPKESKATWDDIPQRRKVDWTNVPPRWKIHPPLDKILRKLQNEP